MKEYTVCYCPVCSVQFGSTMDWVFGACPLQQLIHLCRLTTNSRQVHPRDGWWSHARHRPRWLREDHGRSSCNFTVVKNNPSVTDSEWCWFHQTSIESHLGNMSVARPVGWFLVCHFWHEGRRDRGSRLPPMWVPPIPLRSIATCNHSVLCMFTHHVFPSGKCHLQSHGWFSYGGRWQPFHLWGLLPIRGSRPPSDLLTRHCVWPRVPGCIELPLYHGCENPCPGEWSQRFPLRWQVHWLLRPGTLTIAASSVTTSKEATSKVHHDGRTPEQVGGQGVG